MKNKSYYCFRITLYRAHIPVFEDYIKEQSDQKPKLLMELDGPVRVFSGIQKSFFIGYSKELWETVKLSEMQEMIKEHLRKICNRLRGSNDTGQKILANKITQAYINNLPQDRHYDFIPHSERFFQIKMNKHLQVTLLNNAENSAIIQHDGTSNIWNWLLLPQMRHLHFTKSEFEEAVKISIIDIITSRMNVYELMTFKIDQKKVVDKIKIRID